jgi:hypothetical protein
LHVSKKSSEQSMAAAKDELAKERAAFEPSMAACKRAYRIRCWDDLAMHAFAGAPPVSLMRRIVGVPLGKMPDSLRSRTDQQLAKILMWSPADMPTQLPLPSARTAGRAAFQAGRLSEVLNQQ